MFIDNEDEGSDMETEMELGLPGPSNTSNGEDFTWNSHGLYSSQPGVAIG